MEVTQGFRQPKGIRLKFITKDFGIYQTMPEPYTRERHEEMVKMAEEIGDSCHKDDYSYSFTDDRGNSIVLNPYILRNSLCMIEVLSVNVGAIPGTVPAGYGKPS